MSGVTVLRAGLLTTIQDGGRSGLQHQGVPVSGPMDPFAMRTANLLVGNTIDEATLEVTLLGPELRFDRSAEVAIAGGDLSAALMRGSVMEPLPLRTLAHVSAGVTLLFGVRKEGARAYVAVRGGFDVPTVLGSRATSVQAGLPGLAGRALRSGDIIPIGNRATRPAVLSAPADTEEAFADPATLRFMWGPDTNRVSAGARAAFVASIYTLSSASNRMGYRLDGPAVAVLSAGQVLSEATPIGSIQVPPSGEPILLMADRQTTGGYPRIGTVITADIPIAGQLAPGDRVRFVPCERRQAIEALRRRHEKLVKTGVAR